MRGEAGAAATRAAHRLETRGLGGRPPVHSSSCRPLANTASRLLKSCATPPVLAEQFHLLCQAQRLPLARPVLIAQALGHVIHELVAPIRFGAIPQRVETQLGLRAPVARRIAELLGCRELVAAEGAPPLGLHGGLMLRLRREQDRAGCHRPLDGRRRARELRPPPRG